MQTLSEIRALLAERGLHPKHLLGQNFLHDQNQIRKLIEAADVRSGEVVLEIGPGTGTLTEALVDAGAVVIACELDEGMASIVEERLSIDLIRGDALARQRDLNPEIDRRLAGRAFKLVANLPYQIASPLMTTLLIDPPGGGCMGQFVTIQKEVADRLAAAPSTKAYGPLSVIVQALARVERIGVLSPSCFWPEPEVTSAMVAILPKPDAGRDLNGREREFARFVTNLFTKRRKQLGTIVGRAHPAWPKLQSQGIRPDDRPDAIAPDQMVFLWRAVREQ